MHNAYLERGMHPDISVVLDHCKFFFFFLRIMEFINREKGSQVYYGYIKIKLESTKVKQIYLGKKRKMSLVLASNQTNI